MKHLLAFSLLFTTNLFCGTTSAQDLEGNWKGYFTQETFSSQPYNWPITIQIYWTKDNNYQVITHTPFPPNPDSITKIKATIKIKRSRIQKEETENVGQQNEDAHQSFQLYLYRTRKGNYLEGTWNYRKYPEPKPTGTIRLYHFPFDVNKL